MLDVDAIRELPSDVIDGWIAWKSLGLSDSWAQTGIIAATIHNRMDEIKEIIISFMGGKYKARWMDPEEFIPGRKPRRKTPNALRGKAMVNALKAMCRR